MSDVPPPPPPAPAGPPSGGGVDVGQAFGYAWSKFQANAGQLIAIIAVVVAVNIVGSVLRFSVNSVLLGLILAIGFWIVGQVLSIGVINAGLFVTRGEAPEVGRVFSTDRLGDYIVGSILYGIAVGIGLILCILPGIVLAVMFSFYGYFVLDKQMNGMDALKASFDLVKTNAGSVLVLLIVAFVVNMIGLALCGVGMLVSAPVSQIMIAYAYRKLNGQAVAP